MILVGARMAASSGIEGDDNLDADGRRHRLEQIAELDADAGADVQDRRPFVELQRADNGVDDELERDEVADDVKAAASDRPQRPATRQQLTADVPERDSRSADRSRRC